MGSPRATATALPTSRPSRALVMISGVATTAVIHALLDLLDLTAGAAMLLITARAAKRANLVLLEEARAMAVVHRAARALVCATAVCLVIPVTSAIPQVHVIATLGGGAITVRRVLQIIGALFALFARIVVPTELAMALAPLAVTVHAYAQLVGRVRSVMTV